jgi:8-oxo-dGTP pyrophosphatase MutT (NUDIX family)
MDREKIVGPYIVRSSRSVYSNKWIKLREDQVIRPDGSPGIFGVVNMVEGSSVLPIGADGMVYLVKEFKFAIERESIEVISGALDAGETPLEAAKRELSEELGMTADDWIDLGAVHPFTTAIYSPNNVFLARGLNVAQNRPDPGEILDPVYVSFSEALEMVMRGEIVHAASCVAILKAARLLKV